MTLLTYSAFAIPLWVAQFALYFYLRRAGMDKESLCLLYTSDAADD